MRQIGILSFDEPHMDESRKILHVDMDAFFASVEQRDHPEWRGRPVIVGPDPRETSGKGVVATASYEARRYGVHSAMPVSEAYRLCPDGIFVRPQKSYYKEVSGQIHEVCLEYTDRIEPLSIDEAFLDVTENRKDCPYAMYLARDLQRDIYDRLGLTCSVGVSYNKFLAKLASDYRKPRGITVITPRHAQEFLDDLPIEDFYGVGDHMADKMHELGIEKGSDLRAMSQEDLLKNFGKAGLDLYEHVRGVDNRPVKTDRERKSNGRETTLYPLLYHDEDVEEVLRQLAGQVAQSLEDQGLAGRTITLKFRYADFATYTRQKSLLDPIHSYDDIYFHARDLWDSYGEAGKGVRLLGITLSDLNDISFENVTLPLYEKKGGQP